MKCVIHIPSASTPWPAVKAATALQGAPLLEVPPQSATGTMGSAGELRRIDLLGPLWGERCRLPTHHSSLLPDSHGSKDCTVFTSGLSFPPRMVTCVKSLVPSGSPAEPGWADG